PEGSFFYLTWFAVKEKLLMTIAHAVPLCEHIAEEIDVGPNGQKALAELRDLYAKGNIKDRSSLDFEDCGVMAFRDKVLAHPCNKIKEIHGKDPYKIYVKWETVEATIKNIREFCEAVEHHNLKDWNTTSYLEETGEGADALKQVMRAVRDA